MTDSGELNHLDHDDVFAVTTFMYNILLCPSLNLDPHFLSTVTLDYLSGGAGEVQWSSSQYPDLYTPSSPSWSLHWTYRDSQLVNLPVSLLVEGDVIALRPGQEAFASLRGIKVNLCLDTQSSFLWLNFEISEA